MITSLMSTKSQYMILLFPLHSSLYPVFCHLITVLFLSLLCDFSSVNWRCSISVPLPINGNTTGHQQSSSAAQLYRWPWTVENFSAAT